jgi:hypothetical protein
VHKQQQKAWHNRHLRKIYLKIGDLVLLYDSKVKGNSRKLETTWLGIYVIEDIILRNTIKNTSRKAYDQ